MDDSQINPILLSSSAHLENVEQLIRNLEKQTLDIDNFEDILNDRHRQEIITKSFSSLSSSTMAMDDIPDDNFLIKSITLTNTMGNKDNLSMDSLLTQRELFENDDNKKQQTNNEQSLSIDHDVPAFTWDDQYDTRANYKLTFSTEKSQQIDRKLDKSKKHKHHHHHRHRKHRHDSQSNSIGSDDGIPPNMNDWSMRSSINPLEQSIEQRHSKPPTSLSNLPPQTSFIRSQSHPSSFSSSQQQPSSSNNNNQSPNSSTTSSSSSASWRRMKDSQRTTSGIETTEARPPSPLNLYKIFQQKSQMNASSTSPRSAFQYYRQQTDSIVPNTHESMTISGEKMNTDKSRTSQHQKRTGQYERSLTSNQPSTDQAIQTSMFFESSPTPTAGLKSESSDHLTVPSPAPISSSSIHKSLPDLAFISQYSKELPRSRTTSPSPSPVIIQPKQDVTDKPRTLKSIKRYKSSKHSTEPLNIFYSPQLRKTFAAVPASAVVPGSNEPAKIIKMKLPPPSSYPTPVAGGGGGPTPSQQTANLKSCLKYGSRANSCDIQAMLQDRKSPASIPIIPQPLQDTDSLSPSSKRRCSEADVVDKPSHPIYTHTTGSSNDLNQYLISDLSREHRSDHDLTVYQNQTKKSVSFSENIAKHLISPCNPAIQFDPPTEIDAEENDRPSDQDLTMMMLHGNKENPTKKVTQRYGEMRRCQTDVIVVNRVQHLHSFSESPPNEFRFQDTDSFAPEQDDEDDQTILDRAHVNIIEEPTRILPINDQIEKISPSNDKENKVPEPSINMTVSTLTINPTNDPSLDGILEKINTIVKRIFDIKKSEKAFFLNNENNSQFDSLLKNELCSIVQQVLEHGLKPHKNLPASKQINLWKIIETTIDNGLTLQVFTEAKQTAQNASTYWVYKFQAFIFALLNKNELINWLYSFMKQKDILQRYYQSPDALILAMTPATFTLFDRLMAQLEKLSPLAFRLVFKSDPIPSHIDEQFHTSTISIQSGKSSAREWMATISRRTSKTLTQPIVQPSTVEHTQQNDTIRSTLSRKINSLFTKTNPTTTTTTTTIQRKTSSAVTAKLPTPKAPTTRLASPIPATNRRPRTPTTVLTTKPVIITSPKASQNSRTGTIRRGISPSVVVAPSPPPILNTAGPSSSAFQSKIPRPSLNVDKPKSARYRSTAPPTK